MHTHVFDKTLVTKPPKSVTLIAACKHLNVDGYGQMMPFSNTFNTFFGLFISLERNITNPNPAKKDDEADEADDDDDPYKQIIM